MNNQQTEPKNDAIYANCDPGIRTLVRWLRERHYDTTDSGDGITKPDVGRVLDFPHVFIRVPSGRLAEQSLDLLLRIRSERELFQEYGKLNVEATYSTKDNVALLMVFGEDRR